MYQKIINQSLRPKILGNVRIGGLYVKNLQQLRGCLFFLYLWKQEKFDKIQTKNSQIWVFSFHPILEHEFPNLISPNLKDDFPNLTFPPLDSLFQSAAIMSRGPLRLLLMDGTGSPSPGGEHMTHLDQGTPSPFHLMDHEYGVTPQNQMILQQHRPLNLPPKSEVC